MAHYNFCHIPLAKANYMASPDSRGGKIDSISCWERKNLWPFLQSTTKSRNAGTRVVAHCLSQPPIPHPCNPLLQEHGIHSSLSVSTDGHSILLHPCGERHQPVASKSTTPLFKGTSTLARSLCLVSKTPGESI